VLLPRRYRVTVLGTTRLYSITGNDVAGGAHDKEEVKDSSTSPKDHSASRGSAREGSVRSVKKSAPIKLTA